VLRRHVELDDLARPLAADVSLIINGWQELHTVHDVDPMAAGDRDTVSACLFDGEAHKSCVRARNAAHFGRPRGKHHPSLVGERQRVEGPDTDLRHMSSRPYRRRNRLRALLHHCQLAGYVPLKTRACVDVSRACGLAQDACQERADQELCLLYTSRCV